MKVLIVTAANDRFFPLLQGLVQSLLQWNPAPYAAIACFDLGLSEENRAWLEQYVEHFVVPGWDLDVAEAQRAAHPHWRALTARPFLPNYFPGYDVYQWIDADAWVQERFALDWFSSLAIKGKLAIVPEVDRAYPGCKGGDGLASKKYASPLWPSSWGAHIVGLLLQCRCFCSACECSALGALG